MPKIEVTWSAPDPEGGKRHVCARMKGDRWVFLTRARRHEDWKVIAEPPLEDWLELLDGVRRRVGRHLASPKDEARLIIEIRRRFPGADVGTRGK